MKQHTYVTDEQIKKVFLENGFEIKEGLDDLKPYVYKAARALLALNDSSGSSLMELPEPDFYVRGRAAVCPQLSIEVCKKESGGVGAYFGATISRLIEDH